MRFKITMIFAICTLLLVMIPGYSMTLNAVNAMFWGISGAFVVGILGFFIGGIICNPRGNDDNKWPSFCKGLLTLSNPDDDLPIESSTLQPELEEVEETNTASAVNS